MRLRLIIFAMLFPCLTPGMLFPQDRYERKSISYLDAIYIADPSIKDLSSKRRRFLINQVKDALWMERFDYNPLPRKLLDNFHRSMGRRNVPTLDKLGVLIEELLLPEIQNILDATLAYRAGELVSEGKKQLFLATKAKELGYTVEEIEKVMNSAYIFIPVLTDLDEEKQEKGGYRTSLQGGVLWYQVEVDDQEARITLRLQKNTHAIGFGKREESFRSAARTFARNMKVATQEMPEFTLSAQIAEVNGDIIRFALGKKEGLKIDQTYYVGEWMINNSGKRTFQRTGWALIHSVADNKSNRNRYSTAKAVKRGSWTPGMSLKEHPRLGIDIAVKPKLYPTRISKGQIPVLIGSGLELKENYAESIPGFDLDFQYNLAPWTGSSQLFLLFGGTVAFPTKIQWESDIITEITAGNPMIYGIHGGVLKKIFKRRFSFSYEVKGGALFLESKQQFYIPFTDKKYTYKFANTTFGGQLHFGLEYAVSPDVHLGLQGGYRYYPVSKIWTQSLDPGDNQIILDWNDDYPEINHSGVTFGLYFHYSPPSLPFDPFEALGGLVTQNNWIR